MGYRNYRRKHTVQIGHYRSVRERWEEFKIKCKIVFWTVVVVSVIVLVIVNKKP